MNEKELPEIEKELAEAIEDLKKKYEQAKTLPYVRNRINWALYYTWEDFHRRESG